MPFPFRLTPLAWHNFSRALEARRGDNYHIYSTGTGCAIFQRAFIIFGKITGSHKFWGVIFEK